MNTKEYLDYIGEEDIYNQNIDVMAKDLPVYKGEVLFELTEPIYNNYSKDLQFSFLIRKYGFLVSDYRFLSRAKYEELKEIEKQKWFECWILIKPELAKNWRLGTLNQWDSDIIFKINKTDLGKTINSIKTIEI